MFAATKDRKNIKHISTPWLWPKAHVLKNIIIFMDAVPLIPTFEAFPQIKSIKALRKLRKNHKSFNVFYTRLYIVYTLYQ